MIQRVQTLYLIGVIVAGILLLCVPAASLIVNGEVIKFYTSNVWSLAILAAITILVALITIFCFKKHALQVRLSAFNMIVQLGTAIYLWFYCSNNISSAETGADWHIGIAMAMPIIQLILSILALRGIIKDMIILRNFDRLR